MNKPSYVYIASPLFHPLDLETIQSVENMLERHGIKYFSPRKEGGDLAAIPPAERQAAAKKMYDMNVYAIRDCDLIIVNLDPTAKYPTPVSDLGTVWEQGMAYGMKVAGMEKKIVSFGTGGQRCNIMLAFSTDTHINGISSLEKFFDEWLVEGLDYETLCQHYHRPHGDME